MEETKEKNLFKESMESFMSEMWSRYDSILQLKETCKMAESLNGRSRFIYGDKVNVTVTVDSFKDLFDTLEFLHDQGYECKETFDHPEWNEREYRCGRLTLTAELSGKEEKCRRVVAGVKNQEIIEYKFVCD